jgi:hypothetical protein
MSKKPRLHKYRITLTLEMNEGDFNPHQIDWKSLLSMQKNERCESYVEDFEAVSSWKS